MNCALGVALLGMALLPLNALAQSKAANATSARSSQTKPSASKSKAVPAKAGATHRKAASRYTRRAAARPSYQLHPDPERYQQIQQALAERGYFKGQVNGEWGDDSVDALKRFQADQKLEDDGKISALTLIGLGLGPTHAAGPPGASEPASSNTAPPADAGSSGAASSPSASTTPPR